MRLAILFLLFSVPVQAQTIPRAALQYQRALIGNARFVWGLDAPIAMLAAQIHQESGWNKDAKSPYAGGLAQFTPDTSRWISEKYKDELGDNAPFEPSWALRAINRYDKFLYDRQAGAASDCHRFGFTLSAYNGGEGWLIKQKALTQQRGYDPRKWFGSVENFRVRADWAHRENKQYPRRILMDRQPLYVVWGKGVDCRGIA